MAPADGGSGNYDNLRLVPGKYTIYMGCKLGLSITRNDVEMNIELQAGYTYILDCQGVGANQVTIHLAASYPTVAGSKGIQPRKKDVDKQQELEDLKGLLTPQ